MEGMKHGRWSSVNFAALKTTCNPWIQRRGLQEQFDPSCVTGSKKASVGTALSCCNCSCRLPCTSRSQLGCSREPGVAWTRWSCPHGCGSRCTACTSGPSGWTWRRQLWRICITTGTSASSSAGSWNHRRGLSAVCTVWWVKGREGGRAPASPRGMALLREKWMNC